MSLEFVLLGLLRQPASGYDLAREFEAGVKYFWSAELSQIYPTLQRMRRRGWLSSRKQPSGKGPARIVYARTERGECAFHKWLREEPHIGSERFAYIAQLISLGELHDLDVSLGFLTQLHGRLEFIRNLLDSALNSIGPSDSGNAALTDDDFHARLALQLGVATMTARVSWCEAAIRQVEQRQKVRPKRSRNV
jgi:PadR family transcriptional regulator, regulatory protein AphA